MKRGWLPELARDRTVEAAGVAVIAFGCLLTGLGWAGIREATNVAYQLPVIASGGLLAVGCFIVGGLLLVGGIVMTRFAREEARTRRSSGPPTAGNDDVRLADETVERRRAVRSRRRVTAGSAPEG